MTCVEFQCNTDVLSQHPTFDNCVEYMALVELEDGQGTLCKLADSEKGEDVKT
jgi:hypothetical protein